MSETEYVTCAMCGHRYAGKIPTGGDGSALSPRKHKKRMPGFSFHQRQLIGREYCPGSFVLDKEYQDKGGEDVR